MEEKQFSVGETYRIDDHYYIQRSDSVLHINIENPLINYLPADHLYHAEGDHFVDISGRELPPQVLIPVPYEEFFNAIRKVIYELQLDNYWEPCKK